VYLAYVTLLPVAPLLLTTFSVERLLERVLKALFQSCHVRYGSSEAGLPFQKRRLSKPLAQLRVHLGPTEQLELTSSVYSCRMTRILPPQVKIGVGDGLLVGLWSRHGRRLRERRRLERAVICIDSPVKHAFTFTPAISLYAECESEAEFNAAFGQLSE
jgi:hypothetical protein